MKRSSQSYAGLLSISFLACASFVACGGLDGRTVTRSPDEPVGGDTASAGQGSGNSSAGGSESQGGEPGNPFGGNLGEGGAPVIDGPPEVLKVDPADEAGDAEPTGDVSLLFSEGLDAASVISDNVKVMDGPTEVEGELSYEGVVATFAPSRRLSLLASYDVSVFARSHRRWRPSAQRSLRLKFTVREGVWSKQTQAFDDQDAWGGEQDIAVDDRGNALVVWTRVTGTMTGRRSVFGRWYRASTGWQAEVELEDGPDDAQSPTAAVSADGDAIVAWSVYKPDGNYTVRARRSVSGAWEGAAQDVAQTAVTDLSNINTYPAVAIGGGQVLVTWIRSSVDAYQYYFVQVSQTAIDGAWPETPTLSYSTVYTAPYYDSLYHPSPALDANGNGVVVFNYVSGNLDANYGAGVYYTRKAVAGDWQYPVKIPGSTAVSSGPFLASDGAGAMALWVTADASNKHRVMASRYTKAKQFVAGTDIGDPDLTEYVNLSSDGSLVGNGKAFFASWVQNVGASRNALVAHYDVATGKWDALPAIISDGAASVAYQNVVGVDTHGNAMVLFEQLATNRDTFLMQARFTASDGKWAAAEEFAPKDHNYQAPLLGVAANGVAAAVFRGGGGDFGAPLPNVGGQFRIFK